jgi:hypothetical protein
VVALVGLTGLVTAAVRDAKPQPDTAGFEEADYVLLADSIFAQGCLGSGGGHYGCMCPMIAALEFTGGFTLTPDVHTPPGHKAYDISFDPWLAVFDDNEVEITGDGYYHRWTDNQCRAWHAMTLDLIIDGMAVHCFSGVEENAAPGSAFPDTIEISLDSDTVCFGYLIVIEAERVQVTASEIEAAEPAEEDVAEAAVPELRPGR